jgi:hypothetical protein
LPTIRSKPAKEVAVASFWKWEKEPGNQRKKWFFRIIVVEIGVHEPYRERFESFPGNQRLSSVLPLTADIETEEALWEDDDPEWPRELDHSW